MKPPSPTMRTVASTILADRSFFIEFQGYLSNHAKHAIIALEKLQASEFRVQGYWDSYTALTPYNLPLKPADPWENILLHPTSAKAESNKEWFHSLRGKKQQWQDMCLYLEQERTNRFGGNFEQLVQDYAPELLGGLAGALTHGIIHLGWALDAQSDWMTVEGLAYLNFCYLGVDESKLNVDAVSEKGGDHPIQSMERVAHEFHSHNLAGRWISDTKQRYNDKENFHPELVVAGFQWELSKILEAPHAVATDLPTWLTLSPLDELWRHLYQTVTWLYLATRNGHGTGNFLVLHLITSLWGLEQTCRVIKNDQVTRKAMQQFYATMVCILSASSGGFPSLESLQQVQTEFPLSKTDDLTFDWSPIVERGIQEVEEHNIKLVYVMKELWNRYDHWYGFSQAARSFTTTPNIGPSSSSFKA